MWETLAFPLKEALGALARRVGTFFAAFIVASGVPAEDAAKLLAAVGVVLGLSFDVMLAWFYRRRLKIATKKLARFEMSEEQRS